MSASDVQCSELRVGATVRIYAECKQQLRKLHASNN